MFPKYRKLIFSTFTIFFVVTTPFLIIYSLGYDVNLEKNSSISNTLSIKVETLPRGSSVYNKEFKIGNTPIDLKAADGQTIPIKIQTKDYVDENFLLRGEVNKNSIAVLSPITLLPKNYNQSTELENTQILSLLSSNTLLFYQNSKLYVQIYSFGGIQGKKEEVGYISKREVMANKFWSALSDNVYWNEEDGFVLAKTENSWTLIDLRELPLEISSVVSTSDKQIVLLDTSTKLWTLNLSNKEMIFLDSGFLGIYRTLTPDNIWIWKGNDLFRLSRNTFNVQNFVLSDKVYSQTEGKNFTEYTLTSKIQNFEVASVFQGIVFKLGDTLYYKSDSDKSVWQTLANSVVVFSYDSNTVFWMDGDHNLFSYNLLYKIQENFGKIAVDTDLGDIKIFYYKNWSRIFIYTKNKTYSIWFDKDVINSSVLNYSNTLWIDSAICLPKVVDKFQFCVKENKLVSFKNTALW